MSDTALAERRRIAGFATQKALANAAGVSPPYVCRFEMGRRIPAAKAAAIEATIQNAIDARWQAVRCTEQEAADRLRAPLAAIPASVEKTTLIAVMENRIRELWDAMRLEEGDAILDFLSEEQAQALLDSYFGD